VSSEPDGPRPLLLCLNAGWGGFDLFDEAVALSVETGAPLIPVFVVDSDEALRGPRRVALYLSMMAARRRAAESGVEVQRTVVVRAESVADGLRLAAWALWGEVALALRNETERTALEARGISVASIAW
jgi:hypothetical protein